MAASHVQVAPDSTGKDVDAQSLTSTESGTPTVYRQTATIGDPTTYGNLVSVSAKGTQGSFAISTQDLKDSGRTPFVIFVEAASGTTTEALTTFTLATAFGATGTATSWTVPTGKTARIQAVAAIAYAGAATGFNSLWHLRSAASSVSATSPVFATLQCSTPAATTGSGGTADLSIPDGLEIPAGQQIALTHKESTANASLTVGITITGYYY